MNDSDYLKEYADSIKRLKRECINKGMTEKEFKELYFESLKSLHDTNDQDSFFRRYFIRNKKVLFSITVIVLSFFICKYIYYSFICNIQELIYPVLRLIRKMSIPLISLFPSLTELYQEPCLIQNPFFTIMDMDCWPCSTVNNVRQVYNPQPVHQQHTAPFFYKTGQEEINLMTLKELYFKSKDTFDKEPSKIMMNNKYHVTLSEVIQSKIEDHNLYIWRVNNINVARVLRQKIQRPKVVPKFGQSTERYIIIDASHDSFNIPDTECNFAFLLSLSGSRTIVLNPAEECKHQCKSLKVELKQSYLLWYNWWYYRPMVQQSNGNETFIAHVGSYC